MGPAWLTVTNCAVPQAGQFSYCKFGACCLLSSPPLCVLPHLISCCVSTDFEVKQQKDVVVMRENVPDPPLFRVMSLSIKTLLNPKTHRNELVMVSGLVHNAVSVDGSTSNPNALSSFSIARPPDGMNWPFDLKQVIAGEAKKNGGKVKLHLTPK
jgi:DNA polymerase alpha subunit A